TGVRGATSPAFDVAPAAAARLAFTGQPHTATVDSVLRPPVQVTALDTLGNVATSVAADVTVALAANASGGALGGTPTARATSGVATFADLSVNRAGKGYRLTASSGQLAGATSDSFDITAAPPTTGDLTVNATTTGDNQPGSYTVKVDGALSRTIAANGAGTTYSGLPAGDHTVALTDVPANCTVSGGASQTVTVPAGGAATAAFTITCTQLTGSVTVTTSTSGGTPDSNGYTVTVNGGGSKAIGTNDSVTFPGLATGNHTVTLSGIQSNCSVSGGTSRPVTVITGQTVSVPFTIDCPTVPPPNQPPTAAFTPHSTNLQCTVNDQSSDPDGSVTSWNWSFGDGQTATQQKPSHTYAAAGSYTVTLTVKDNQNASSSPASQTVNVTVPPPPNQPPTAAFTPHCTNLQCSFSDQSSEQRRVGKEWRWSW